MTFSVAEGEIFAIVGPNGAGKSTIFNLISRIYEPTGGRLLFQGEDITRVPAHTIAGRGIARTFQNIELFEHATVLDNLLIGRHCRARPNILAELLFTPGVRREELRHREAVEEIIDFLDLANYREQRISGLPYGVRKVVELARALCAQPKLLLLDEPASGLNTEETEEVAFWIEDIKNDLGVTVIMIEHDMSLVSAVSNRVLALNNGRMLALGTPARGAVQPGRDRGLPGRRGGMSEPLLSVRNLETYYGPITAIRGVSFDVDDGQIVTILGANGAGKTTVLKSVCGAMEPQKGTSPSPAAASPGREPDWVARHGIAHVPEGREIFPFMTVKGNLMMGAYARQRPGRHRARPRDRLRLFPDPARARRPRRRATSRAASSRCWRSAGR